MADKRMFARSIVTSDAFLDMGPGAKSLYFILGLYADDEGFVGNPKSIVRLVGAGNKDLEELINKRYILMFDSGVIVIKHWYINNYIRKDKMTKTTYVEEKSLLTLDDKNAYTELGQSSDGTSTDFVPNRIEENKIKENSIVENNKDTKHKYGEYKNVLLTDAELEKLKTQFTDYEDLIKELDEGIELKGYKYKSHYLAIIKWSKNRKVKKETFATATPSYDSEAMKRKAQSAENYIYKPKNKIPGDIGNPSYNLEAYEAKVKGPIEYNKKEPKE